MGGVNTNRNYAQLMGFGQWSTKEGGQVTVTKPVLQGGIVSQQKVVSLDNYVNEGY